jgi:hypothetical protein
MIIICWHRVVPPFYPSHPPLLHRGGIMAYHGRYLAPECVIWPRYIPLVCYFVFLSVRFSVQKSKLAVGATKLNPIPHAPHSQAGIYNGALGSVFGVLFPRDEPTTAVPSEAHALTLGLDRTPAAEMPIVLVQMDRHGDKGYKGEAFFKDRDGKPIAGLENVVPFTAKP